MRSLDTENLRAFIAVAEHASFSRAADALGLTQPAVSKRIAQLESQLGCKLFDRFKKRIALNEAGHVLMPYARSVLQDLEEAFRSIGDLGGEVSGKLGIAFSHHIGLHRLPPHLKTFTERYPKARMDIAFVDSEQGYARVEQGLSELALVTLAPAAIADIVTTPLWSDPLVFVCSPEHELHLRNSVGLETLASLDAILPAANTYTGKIVSNLFEQRDLKLDTGMTTNYLETIKMMVSIGLGWSVLPRTMTDGLEVIHVEDTYLERKLGLVQHAARSLSNAGEAFRELLIEAAN
ncbi:MAG: LysR family transcriptional regulator [Gammaproteobacteria bacterium]|nr:LysR family transcriptional regulator [Gammaproteobacteria bacterium]MBT8152296.1 LysR family transcriptional regulator [Gammaproteobacteria bacterium]NND38049.1 LysR family transcriptional regulator [Pseudomonadales bacterium]NNM10646.1 LysR family transcriptional regulator [Pseudomonadales bacterium]RZV59477.1 MAG: LysR family transcriptional regulator [Pseudomonadales bacterium]